MSIDIAREVAAALAENERVIPEGWKWQKGVVLFPETRCPFCKDVIRSRAIWLVRGYKLLGQGVPVAGRPFKLDPPRHPHATPSDICMGNAVDPLQALFNALNPRSSYFNPDDQHTGGMGNWFRGPYWEHDCAEMQEAEDRWNGHEDEFCCTNCNEYYSYDDEFIVDDLSYCQECYHESFFNCAGCSEDFSLDDNYPARGERYCSDCFNERFFTCEGCSSAEKQDNCYVNDDGESFCEDCYYTRYFRCSKCDDECSVANRVDDESNVCNECAPTACDGTDCNKHYDSDVEGRYCTECIKNLCPSCVESHPPEHFA